MKAQPPRKSAKNLRIIEFERKRGEIVRAIGIDGAHFRWLRHTKRNIFFLI